MWKWLLGVVVVIVVLVAAAVWSGYRKLTAGGDSSRVAIVATPDRVYGMLVDVDSLSTWLGDSTKVTSNRHGALQVGDSLRIEDHLHRSNQQNLVWVVSDLVSGKLRALEIVGDSGRIAATERDSLSTSGDSTIVVTTIASPLMDSVKAKRGDTGGRISGAALNFGSKMIVSAFRLIAETEMKQLKARLEGTPAAAH